LNWLQLLPVVNAVGLRMERPLVAGRPLADPGPRQFAFLFYTLTGLHGLHVLGGLAAFAFALRTARRALDPAVRLARVTHAIVYWHFLAAMWLILYGVLLI
jgi:heme/copper-type cytochrome/quinol oxidase subunit 3